MAVADFALALFALLGTLLVPFAVLHQMLRLKRRAVRNDAPADLPAPAAPRGDCR